MTAMAWTDRRSSASRPRSAATRRDGADAGRAARGRAGRAAARRGPGLRGVELRDAGDARDRPGLPRPTRIRGRRTGPRSASSCRANATASPSGLGGAVRRAPADPRRRLHRARRRDGRTATRPARAPARHRLVRCPRRLQHARHDAVGQRLGHAVRDALRARRPRPRRRRRRPDGERGGCRAARRPGPRRDRVADARGRRGWRSSGPGCSATTPGMAALDGWARPVAGASTALHRVRHGLPRRVGRLGA